MSAPALPAPGARTLDQFPFAQVARSLVNGEIVVFLGAGASIAGSEGEHVLPNGKQLAAELREEMEGGYPGEDGDALAKVAQVYEYTVFDRGLLYQFLHKRFYTAQPRDVLARCARMLAAIPSANTLFIVTTNYDTQVELAFEQAKRPLCVITQNTSDREHAGTDVTVSRPDAPTTNQSAQDFLYNDPQLPPATAVLYKMHGSAHFPPQQERDGLVITEDDYVDFLLNAGVTSPFLPPPNLTATFKTRRFLFLGYSLEDWNLRAFLRLLALRHALSKGAALRHWAIQRDPATIESLLWSYRNVTLHEGELDAFCDLLATHWGGPDA
jgi:hypothetical protein